MLDENKLSNAKDILKDLEKILGKDDSEVVERRVSLELEEIEV